MESVYPYDEYQAVSSVGYSAGHTKLIPG